MPLSELIDEHAVIARLEIQRGLGRVEGKLDQIILGMESHEERDQFRFADVGLQVKEIAKRQSSVEKKIWMWSGGLAIIAFIVSHVPFAKLFGL